MIRTYRELSRLRTFEERFEYLSLGGRVGVVTFGFDRYLNQRFYRSREWKELRHHVIVRDEGRDLGAEGWEIHGPILIHHMNPVEPRDLIEHRDEILDPEYLVVTSHATHNAIHYGDASLLPRPFVPRHRGDTKLW